MSSSGDYIDEIFGPTGALSKRFPGYSPRPGQVAMARAVDLAIRERSHALIEAGTGTGKSIAYAVPAIYHVTHPQPRLVMPPPPPMPDEFDLDEEVLVTRCSVCSRRLKDPESIALGIGPECRRSSSTPPRDSSASSTGGGPPALPWPARARFNAKAVIVTANIALQEQLVKKDLPMLSEVLPWKFSYGLLKGMSNYLCLSKLDDQAERVFPDDLGMDEQIREWAENTETGDKSELPFEPPPRLWSHFSTSPDECSGQDCEFFKKCFPKIARKKAVIADVIVTNYALFFLDLVVRIKSLGNFSILPKFDIVIMDEGHKAVGIARDHFGWCVTEGAIDWAGSGLPPDDKIALHKAQSKFFFALKNHKMSGEYKARIKKTKVVETSELLEQLERAIEVYGNMLFGRGISDEDRIRVEKLLRLGDLRLNDNENEAALARERANEILKKQINVVMDQRERIKLSSKQKSCGRIIERIKEAMCLYALPSFPWVKHPTPGWYHSDPALGGDNSVKNEDQFKAIEKVFFIEEKNGRVALGAMPVSLAEVFRNELFRTTGSIIVTSATLASNKTFDFIRDDLGIVEASKPPVKTLIADSPFNWPQQALLVLPSDLPEPNAPDFVQRVVECLRQTLDLAQGRTLALFTSYKNMQAAYERLKSGPWKIYKQGDMPRTQLIDAFRKDTSSVLFGVESFWAGVDVQGESLSCVFIDKLPFATPDDPLLDALAERDSRGWFKNYSVPQAIIAFKQGFGRLIRTTTDKGVVVCCDRRLTTKFYGQMFLQSLPPVQQSVALGDVKRFLDGEALLGVRRVSTGKSLFESL